MIDILLAGVLYSSLTAPGDGDVSVSTTEALVSALKDAKPGARILVAPGRYEGFFVANVKGSSEHPIVVEAADEKSPPTIVSGVQASDVEYIELVGLVFEGAPANGLNIDDAGTMETPSHHVTLRRVTVRDCGKRGNEDGIKLSGVDDFLLEGCTIERWGRGGSAIDMVGCHRGVIANCSLLDRAIDTAASGIQMKGGSRDVRITQCRFEYAGTRAVNIGGSTGLEYFRPALGEGEHYEAKDIIVEGSTFVGSEAPIAFVGVDGATVSFNTFYRPAKWCLRILQETKQPGFVPCRNGRFTDNLVALRRSEVHDIVNIGPDTAADSFEFARNYWFDYDDPLAGAPKLPVEEKEPAGGFDPHFRDPSKGDLRVAPASPARSFGASAFKPAK